MVTLLLKLLEVSQTLIGAKRYTEMEQTMDLSDIPTCDLVKELQTREGVETTIAEPYQDAEVKVNGPTIVLVVTD